MVRKPRPRQTKKSQPHNRGREVWFPQTSSGFDRTRQKIDAVIQKVRCMSGVSVRPRKRNNGDETAKDVAKKVARAKPKK